MAASSLSFSWSFFRVSFIGLCRDSVLVAIGAAVYCVFHTKFYTFASNRCSAAGFAQIACLAVCMCVCGWCTCVSMDELPWRRAAKKNHTKRNVLRAPLYVCMRDDGCVRRPFFGERRATTHITLLNNSTMFERFSMRQWQIQPQIPSNIRHISNHFQYRYVWTCDSSLVSCVDSIHVSCFSAHSQCFSLSGFAERVETACASLYVLFSAWWKMSWNSYSARVKSKAEKKRRQQQQQHENAVWLVVYMVLKCHPTRFTLALTLYNAWTDIDFNETICIINVLETF